MQNDKSKFKKRLYKFTLGLIEYIDKLPKDRVSSRLAGQLIKSGTSIIGNYIEQFLKELAEISNIFASGILTMKNKK
jgi:hypothetical protein